ncbi:MAG: hypothetical protein FJX64_12610 [Alphaproteobacteria bacterium]|nr:hypothetical protein [Alphaproteobacteria bacterium]
MKTAFTPALVFFAFLSTLAFAQPADPPPVDAIEGLNLGIGRAEAFWRLSGAGFRIAPNEMGSSWVAAKAVRRWPDAAGGIEADDYLMFTFCGDTLYRISRHTRLDAGENPDVNVLLYGDGVIFGHQLRHRREDGERLWRDARLWDDRLCPR